MLARSQLPKTAGAGWWANRGRRRLHDDRGLANPLPREIGISSDQGRPTRRDLVRRYAVIPVVERIGQANADATARGRVRVRPFAVLEILPVGGQQTDWPAKLAYTLMVIPVATAAGATGRLFRQLPTRKNATARAAAGRTRQAVVMVTPPGRRWR